MTNLTNSIDFLWEFAEIHGVADRLVVVMGSDFGRTNHYNVDAGKDHWPIGSFVVMGKNPSRQHRSWKESPHGFLAQSRDADSQKSTAMRQTVPLRDGLLPSAAGTDVSSDWSRGFPSLSLRYRL